MVRPRLQFAALLLLLLSASMTQAQLRDARVPAPGMARSSTLPASTLRTTTGENQPVIASLAPFRMTTAALAITLPPEPKVTSHWPWWLRILAVIFVFVFIRIVAGSVRNKPSGPSPS